MKKRNIIIIIFLIIIAATLVFYRNHTEKVASDENSSANTYTQDSFSGILQELVENNSGTVLITDGNIKNSGEKVIVNFEDKKFQVGDYLYVVYDGNISESYPLQINELEIYKIIGQGKIIDKTDNSIDLLSDDIVDRFEITNLDDYAIDDYVLVLETPDGNKAIEDEGPKASDCVINT